MAVSKKLRFEVFKRDAFACQYCGRTPPAVVLECDHITAVSNGGTDEEHNLITACFDCNRGKSDVPLSASIPSLAERMAREVEIAEQADAYSKLLARLRRKEEKVVRSLGAYWYDRFMPAGRYTFAGPSAASMRTFLKKLTETEIRDAMDKAYAKVPPRGHRDGDTFRYFCGICWKTIKASAEVSQ